MTTFLRTTSFLKNTKAIVLSLLFVVSCLPVQKKTQCGDNEAFDGSQRRCVPVIGAASTGTVFITSRAPGDSYVVNPTSTSVSHSISVSDVYSYGYSIKWYVHYLDSAEGSQSVKVANNVTSYTFVPKNISGLYGTGSYVLEAIVYDTDGDNQLDSTTWSLEIQAYVTPSLHTPDPSGVAFSFPRNSSSDNLEIDISNPAGVDTYFQWYLDGVAQLGTPTTATSSASVTATIDPSSMTLGMHTVEVELRDASAGSYNVHDNYVWTVNITDPDLPTLVTLLDDSDYDLVSSGTVYAIDGNAFGANGYINDTGYDIQDICVTVDDYDKDDDATTDVRLRLSINGLTAFTQDFTANELCIDDFGYVPPTQNLTVPQSTINKSFTFHLVNSLDNTIIESYPLNLIVRPKNIAPAISIRHASSNPASGCDTTDSYNTTGCTMTQSLNANSDSGDTDYVDTDEVDNSKTFDIYVTDADEDDHFDVHFELSYNGGSYQALDTSQTNTGPNVLCDWTDTAIASSYSCQLYMDAFGSSGSIPEGSYSVRAWVQDNNTAYGGAIENSNYVTWDLTVSEYQTDSIAVTDITAVNHDGDGTCAAAGGGQLQEGSYMLVTIEFEDLERDDIASARIYLENQYTSGMSSIATLSTPTVIGAADGLTKTVEHCVKIPEWAVVGIENDNIEIQATVTDSPDSSTADQSTTGSATIGTVLNNNHLDHIPGLDDFSTVDLSDESLVAFSGHTFIIDPPDVSDTSTYGGENIEWQWQYSEDGTNYVNITGATHENAIAPGDMDLYWTPDPGISSDTLWLRICVGDDGYGNPADCSNAGANPKTAKVYENLTIEPGSKTLEATASDEANTENVASWYDSDDKFLYIAYGNGTEILVEKIDHSDPTAAMADRTKHFIRFPAEDPESGFAAKTVVDIKLTGVNQEYLLVVYTVPNDDLGYNEMRVNRINLRLGGVEAFGFKYDGLFDSSTTDNQNRYFFNSLNNNNDPVQAQSGSDMTLTFDDDGPQDDPLVFVDSSNAQIDFEFGAGNDYCTGACGNAATIGFEFVSSIMDESGGKFGLFGQEIVATDAGAGVVNLYSNPTDAYVSDDSVSVVKLGEPIVDTANYNLYVPIIDAFRDSRVTIFQVIAFDSDPLTVQGSSYADNTANQANNSDLGNAINSDADGIHIVAKGPDGNLDYYTATFGGNPTLQAADIIPNSISNEYDDLDRFAITADESDNVMIAGIVSSTGGVTNLLSGTIEDILSDATSSELFAISTFTPFIDQYDQVSISARPGVSGEAIIGLTTAAGSAGYTARVMQVKSTIVGDDVTAVDFPDEGDWTPPALYNNGNVQRVSAGGRISMTPVFDIELGNASDSSTSTDYATFPSVFFSYIEDSGGTGEGDGSEVIRSIIVNVNESDNPILDDSSNFFYPPFVKDQ